MFQILIVFKSIRSSLSRVSNIKNVSTVENILLRSFWDEEMSEIDSSRYELTWPGYSVIPQKLLISFVLKLLDCYLSK